MIASKTVSDAYNLVLETILVIFAIPFNEAIPSRE